MISCFLNFSRSSVTNRISRYQLEILHLCFHFRFHLLHSFLVLSLILLLAYLLYHHSHSVFQFLFLWFCFYCVLLMNSYSHFALKNSLWGICMWWYFNIYLNCFLKFHIVSPHVNYHICCLLTYRGGSRGLLRFQSEKPHCYKVFIRLKKDQ